MSLFYKEPYSLCSMHQWLFSLKKKKEGLAYYESRNWGSLIALLIVIRHSMGMDGKYERQASPVTKWNQGLEIICGYFNYKDGIKFYYKLGK